MKIIVSQQNKKLIIEFKHGKVVDKYLLDKAEEFLLALDTSTQLSVNPERSRRIDKFLRRRNIRPISHIGPIGHIEFENTGVLTERIIRSIIAGLRF